MNDAVSAATTGFSSPSSNATLASTADTAGDSDTGTAVTVYVGDTGLLVGETFTTGLAANYTASSWTCSGTDTNPEDNLDIVAADAGSTITCTISNSRKSAQLQLKKDWTNAIVNDAVSAATTGFSSPSSNATLASTADTAGDSDTGTAVTVYVGDTGLLVGETFTTGLAANYTASSWTCSGTDTNPEDNLDIVAADAGSTITCEITNTFVPRDEGCTPGYWKNTRQHAWDHLVGGLSPTDTLVSIGIVAGTFDIGTDTLMDALKYKGGKGVEGATRNLLRHAVAAYLNASHPDVSFGPTPGDIITAVNAAILSDDRQTILALAGDLGELNEAGCSIDAHGRAKTSLVTTPSADGDLFIGVALSDNANLGGSVIEPPTGTITFNLYNPSDASCTGTPEESRAINVGSGNGVYSTGTNHITDAGGIWHWTATFNSTSDHSTDAHSGCEKGPVDVDAGSITIEKQTIPGQGEDDLFDFAGGADGLSWNSLEDNQSDINSDLVAGDYDITETLAFGAWELVSIDCGGASTTEIINGVLVGVTVHLAAGEDVTCIFNNTFTAE